MRSGAVRYREYAPCGALRDSVRAVFSFSESSEEPSSRPVLWEAQFGHGERVCAPSFADAHPCIVFSFERYYGAEGVWRSRSEPSRGEVIGPMLAPGPPSVPVRRESIGVYFRAGVGVPGASIAELENRVVGLEAVWGGEARRLAEEMSDMRSQTARIHRLESALARRVETRRQHNRCLDVPGMAAWILERRGLLPVERLAQAAGLSRQYFTRVFRGSVGVTPKVYCQLARLRPALAYVAHGEKVDWAQVAAECGYADQSHMIAEFRRFTGMTPEALLQGRWFHPFIERAVRRFRGPAEDDTYERIS
ncbi:MAG TPA: AraC family transcriptional regulator [Bryobacteraceae bacterium]|nr:AraC family transcriptional regulator [Bryobacteraceae bacterium]